MPVVPINRPVRQAPSLPKPDDPWLLMAAATMDAQGRLMHPSIEDRRDQGRKERDDRMVEDLQLPPLEYEDPEKVVGRLSRDAGSGDLDRAWGDTIVKIIEQGLKK